MIKKYIGDRAFYRRLLAVMIPVLIQNVITNFVSLLDNVMVGRIGTEPMSGVAIVNQIFFIFNISIFGGLSGAGIFTAQYYGKQDNEGIRNSMRAKIWIALGISVTAAAVMIAFGDQLISLFIHEGEEDLDLTAALEYGKSYMKIMLLQIPPFALLNVYSDTLRGTGETRLPMVSGVIAVGVNLFFNYMLIYGKLGAPELGVVGAAIATVLARFVECGIVVCKTHFVRNRNTRYIEGVYRTLKVPRDVWKQIVKLGSPLLINEFLWSGGMTTLNQVMSMRGLEVVSAENICRTVSDLFFCSFFAMGTTISIIVGQLLGAGETERAVDEDRKLIAFSVSLCGIVGLVMIFLSSYIPNIYNTTPVVKKLAASMLIVNAVMMPSNAFTNACYFTIRSGGKTIITFLFDSMYLWVLSIPITLALVKLTNLTIIPIYIISYGLDIVKCIAGYILVKKRIWVNNLVAGE